MSVTGPQMPQGVPTTQSHPEAAPAASAPALAGTTAGGDEVSGWQNIGSQGWRRYLDAEKVIYRSTTGTYSAADQAGWLPGIYADEAAAETAIRIAQTDYSKLAHLVHWQQRGEGDDYRPVTVADLAGLDGDKVP